MFLCECFPLLIVFLWRSEMVLSFEHESSKFLDVFVDSVLFQVGFHERELLEEMEGRNDHSGGVSLDENDFALVAEGEVARIEMAVSRVDKTLVFTNRSELVIKSSDIWSEFHRVKGVLEICKKKVKAKRNFYLVFCDKCFQSSDSDSVQNRHHQMTTRLRKAYE